MAVNRVSVVNLNESDLILARIDDGKGNRMRVESVREFSMKVDIHRDAEFSQLHILTDIVSQHTWLWVYLPSPKGEVLILSPYLQFPQLISSNIRLLLGCRVGSISCEARRDASDMHLNMHPLISCIDR